MRLEVLEPEVEPAAKDLINRYREIIDLYFKYFAELGMNHQEALSSQEIRYLIKEMTHLKLLYERPRYMLHLP